MSENELELYAKNKMKFSLLNPRKFKKAGMLRVLTRIWNKEGVETEYF